MNSTLQYIFKKYNLSLEQESSLHYLKYTRLELTKLFHELNFKCGAEIGVLYGEYSKTLCEQITGLKLYCIDTWETYPDLPEGKSHNFQERMRRGYNHAKDLLKDYNCKFIKKFSMDAVNQFERNSLDFVYIDANHSFDYVMKDIIEWTKIVKPGGIVSGHDFNCFGHDEVGKQISAAVEIYTKMHDIKPIFIYNADRSTSWFFVKELKS